MGKEIMADNQKRKLWLTDENGNWTITKLDSAGSVADSQKWQVTTKLNSRLLLEVWLTAKNGN
jgi:hypothetical protein